MNVLLLLAAVALSVVSACPDPCELSDPKHQLYNIYSAAQPLIQIDFIAQCKIVEGNQTKYAAFVANLLALCTAKGLECPPCEECDICDFSGQPCFDAFPKLMQECMIKDCEAVKSDIVAYNDFLKNLNMICEIKELDPIENPCCNPCNFTDPPQECFMAMSSIMQDCIVADCNAVVGTSGYQALLDNLNLICEEKDFEPLVNPCDECNITNVCLIFAVDISGSVPHAGLLQEIAFVQAFIDEFGPNMANNNIRIGLMSFAATPNVQQSLCDDQSEAASEAALTAIKNNDKGVNTGATAIGNTILSIIEDLNKCCNETDRKKFFVVLTDGHNNVGISVQGAMDQVVVNVPDVSAIAVGFGDANENELKIISDDDIGVLKEDDVTDLIGIVRNYICKE